jgi:sporulation-control protein
MFTKLLSTFGIGSAKVDTQLEYSTYKPGDEVRGETFVVGGELSQKIDDIYMTVTTFYLERQYNQHRHYHREYRKVNINLAHFKIAPEFTITPKEKRSFPFTIKLPIDTPLTLGGHSVWIKTGLDIDNAIDPKDTDAIDVFPSPIMEKVFNSLQTLGFTLKTSKCMRSYSLSNHYPFSQEFEFKVTPLSQYYGKVNEIGLFFIVKSTDEIEVILEVAKHEDGLGGLLKDAFNLNEHEIRFLATSADLEKSPEHCINALINIINKAIS